MHDGVQFRFLPRPIRRPPSRGFDAFAEPLRTANAALAGNELSVEQRIVIYLMERSACTTYLPSEGMHSVALCSSARRFTVDERRQQRMLGH
jgi:hypothetical protein